MTVKEPNLRFCPFKRPPPVFHLGDDGGGHVSAHVVKVAVHSLGSRLLQALTVHSQSAMTLVMKHMVANSFLDFSAKLMEKFERWEINILVEFDKNKTKFLK